VTDTTYKVLSLSAGMFLPAKRKAIGAPADQAKVAG
jgi:hypothetical protein